MKLHRVIKIICAILIFPTLLVGFYTFKQLTLPKAHEITNPSLAHNLGLKFQSLDYPFSNANQSIQYLEQAVSLGSAESTSHLALRLYYSKFEETGCENLLEFIENHTDQNPNLGLLLYVKGLIYSDTRCKLHNEETALNNFLQAEKLGESAAIAEIMHYYSFIKRDEKKSDYWMSKMRPEVNELWDMEHRYIRYSKEILNWYLTN